jgi:splicing factor 3B subunit 2
MSNVVTFQDIRADQQLINQRSMANDVLFEDVNEVDLETDDMTKNGKHKDSKRKRNRKKKSSGKKVETVVTNGNHNSSNENSNNKENDAEDEDEIEIEFVPEEITLDKNFADFSRIFEYFKLDGSGVIKPEEKVEEKVAVNSKAAELERLKARMFEDEEEDERDKIEKNKEEPKLSKKKLKLQTRLSVAALKQLVNRPDVVEMHDVTALDPKLLVHLKATRNTVQVPRHWCAKRKYLQGKRGFEKPAFDLPDFIKRTGIQGMREALSEKEDKKSLKQKMREKVRPKMGKIDIDYQKLHDAFFRWQTKPKMSIHGDLYYEVILCL